MTDLTTMIAGLKAGDVDSVLVGTMYHDNGERLGFLLSHDDMGKQAIAAYAKYNAAKVIVQSELIRVLLEALDGCYGLFSSIRSDWTDPRSECREGWAVIEAAIAAANEMKDA